MASKIFKILIIALVLSSPICGMQIFKYQNDFAEIVQPEESKTVPAIKEFPKIEDEPTTIMKFIQGIQEKLQRLEENEEKLKIELARTQMELKRKEKMATTTSKPIENEKSDVDGFWNTIFKIGKGLLTHLFNFFGIKI
jgi:hypothetical protein